MKEDKIIRPRSAIEEQITEDDPEEGKEIDIGLGADGEDAEAYSAQVPKPYSHPNRPPKDEDEYSMHSVDMTDLSKSNLLRKMPIKTFTQATQPKKESACCIECLITCSNANDIVSDIFCCCIKPRYFRNTLFCASWLTVTAIIVLMFCAILLRILFIEPITDLINIPQVHRYVPYMNALNSPDFSTQSQVCYMSPQLMLYPSVNSVGVVALSGSNWIRYLLEEGTRILTTSAGRDCDVELQASGYRGECLSERTFYNNIITSFKKYDEIYENYKGFYAPSALIFIIRNPFEGAIEEFGRKKAADGAAYMEFVLPKDRLAKREVYEQKLAEWNQYLNNYVMQWVKDYKIFQKPLYYTTSSNITQNLPVHVIFYEDIYDVDNFEREMTKILDFIRENRQQRGVISPTPLNVDMVSNKLFFKCLNNKTKISAKSLPITVDDIDPFRKKALCQIIGDLWSVEKWGDECSDHIKDPTSSPSFFSLK